MWEGPRRDSRSSITLFPLAGARGSNCFRDPMGRGYVSTGCMTGYTGGASVYDGSHFSINAKQTVTLTLAGLNMLDPLLNIGTLLGVLLEILGTTIGAFFLPFSSLILNPIFQFFGLFTA